VTFDEDEGFVVGGAPSAHLRERMPSVGLVPVGESGGIGGWHGAFFNWKGGR
jgi:hypothetical protein